MRQRAYSVDTLGSRYREQRRTKWHLPSAADGAVAACNRSIILNYPEDWEMITDSTPREVLCGRCFPR